MQGYANYRNASKFNIKITLGPEENLLEKLVDLEDWKRLTNSSDQVVFNMLVQKGLSGEAKKVYRHKNMTNHDAVNTLQKLLDLLFDRFDWKGQLQNQRSDLFGLKQNATSLLNYYRDFVMKRDTYVASIAAVRDRVPPVELTLVKEPEDDQLYRRFLNSLQPKAREELTRFITSQQLPQIFASLESAVESVQQHLYPAFGIKGPSAVTSTRSKGATTDRPSQSKQRQRSTRNGRSRSNRVRFRGADRSDRSGPKRSRKRQKRDASNVECFNCGKMGHYANDCHSKPRNTDSKPKGNKRDKSSIECWNCGKMGHYSSECHSAPRNRPNNDQGRNTNATPKPSKGRKKQSNLINRSQGRRHRNHTVNFVTTPNIQPNRDVRNYRSGHRANVDQEELDNIDDGIERE